MTKAKLVKAVIRANYFGQYALARRLLAELDRLDAAR